MKALTGKILVSIWILLAVNLAWQIDAFSQGITKNIARDEVLIYITDIVRQFDKHAKKMGGTGFFYGVKSKIFTIFTYEHRDSFEESILRTPGYMLYTNGIKEDNPNLGKIYETYCRTMPSAYDTYRTCKKKIRRSVELLYPEKDEKFYDSVIRKIRETTGVDWL